QIGIAHSVYLTLGLRAERNPSYGRSHKIDWTPTNGITYTVEFGELTAKLLGSYGRSTRAPVPSMRREVIYTGYTGYDPSFYVSQREAKELTPEYSRGPQGGVELYYGNVGSLTINRYYQKTTDLIQRVPV